MEIKIASIHDVIDISYIAYSGTSGRRFRKHPDTKPEASGHFAG
ncbi:hypothetical protein [Sinanaerobacter chloroacetimidivorans]|nr:hypothetical protein [Sinanaerobacter chloroacetimidivorans]